MKSSSRSGQLGFFCRFARPAMISIQKVSARRRSLFFMLRAFRQHPLVLKTAISQEVACETIQSTQYKIHVVDIDLCRPAPTACVDWCLHAQLKARVLLPVRSWACRRGFVQSICLLHVGWSLEQITCEWKCD